MMVVFSPEDQGWLDVKARAPSRLVDRDNFVAGLEASLRSCEVFGNRSCISFERWGNMYFTRHQSTLINMANFVVFSAI